MQIDAVIAWVDGGDPAHRTARARFSGKAADGDERFVQAGEIYIAIASILKHAHFIGRIFVVTDNQTPANLDAFADTGLCASDRIRIVDHDTIFDGLPAARPNFNSRAIEAAIHRIPGLSDWFVYFNDDMFVNRDVGPDAFFDPDGTPVIVGQWQRPSHARPMKRLVRTLRAAAGRPDARPGHQIAQETSAALMGYTDRFLRVPHRPHALRLSTLDRVLSDPPGRLAAQVAHRFRHRSQFLPVVLAAHAELADGAVPRLASDTTYLRDRTGMDFDAGLQAIERGATLFACIQNVESISDVQRARVLTLLSRKFADHLPPVIRDTLGNQA